MLVDRELIESEDQAATSKAQERGAALRALRTFGTVWVNPKNESVGRYGASDQSLDCRGQSAKEREMGTGVAGRAAKRHRRHLSMCVALGLGCVSLLVAPMAQAATHGPGTMTTTPASVAVASGAPETMVQRYIRHVYADLFNRAPDPGGLATWTTALSSGTPRVAVANAITSSTEYRTGLITASYQRFLSRTPDAGGLAYWLGQMNAGWTISRMESGFITSPEYYARAGSTPAGWVGLLFTDVLGRSAGSSEVAYWVQRIGSGMPRDAVAMGFLLSTERLNTVVAGYYGSVLGRGIDLAGQAYWVAILQAGGRNEAIIGGIVASEEYWGKNAADIPAGFSLTWSDDFNDAAGTGVPGSNWIYDTGAGATFGTGEIETMTNSTANVREDGASHLVLQALHTGTDPATNWTSGRIESEPATFGAPAGGVVRMEASIQQPNVTAANGAGYWPAFWMLGSTLRTGTAWPTSGEIDILEDINGRSSVFGTLHCGTFPGGPCNESTGLSSGEQPCPGCQTGFHDYAVEIDRSTSPEEIRWYLDGSKYFTLQATAVDAGTWAAAVHHPFYIIFDLAMGGGFPAAFGGGPNSSTVSGAQLIVDFVAVYNKP